MIKLSKATRWRFGICSAFTFGVTIAFQNPALTLADPGLWYRMSWLGCLGTFALAWFALWPQTRVLDWTYKLVDILTPQRKRKGKRNDETQAI